MQLMRAATIDKAGPAESFTIRELPIPTPTDGQVLIRQDFAAVNFGDVTRRKRGLFPAGAQPPYVLGFEGVGQIAAIGAPGGSFRIGDRVAYLSECGGYAECVSVSANTIWKVPEDLKAEEAAGISCVGLTAWGLSEAAGVRPGQTAIVHGAAGGVGSVLVQLLVGMGVRVLALVTGKEKAAFVSKFGADAVLDHRSDDFGVALKSLVGTDGADVIFDCVGQDALDLNLRSIRKGGQWLYYGSTSGHPQFPGDRVLMNSLAVQGFVVFDYFRDQRRWREGTSFLRSALVRGSIRPTVTAVLPLAEVGEAHRRLENREVMGKQVLKF